MQAKLENILFLDIETVPQYPSYKELPEKMKKLWDKKSQYIGDSELSAEEKYKSAGIYSEFGKIIVIAIGYIRIKNNEKTLIIKSIYGHDEVKILQKFNQVLDEYFASDDKYLCAHNGKEFDFPYIARRSIINEVKLPKILNTAGAKPWEVKHLDTLELWKFGDYKHWTSLDLLTTIFGIPSPKDEIDGSQVYEYYWQKNDLETINNYCKKDVVALVQVYLRLTQQELIPPENIFYK